MLTMSVFRLIRPYGRFFSKSSVALRSRIPQGIVHANFPKHPRQTRLYSEHRPNITDKTERRLTSKTSDVLWSLALFLWLGVIVHNEMYSSHQDYIREGVSKAFDDLVDLSRREYQTTEEIACHFLAIAITANWSIFPEDFQEGAIYLMNLTAVCGGAAVPVMSTVCKDVAAVMSTLPESGVDIQEKAKVCLKILGIVLEAKKKLHLIYRFRTEPVLLGKLQEMRQREMAKEKLENHSYSPIG